MDQPENADNVRSETYEGWVSGAAYKDLGPKDNQADALMPSINIQVEGIEPAHYAPAGARPYEGTAKRGQVIRENLDQAERATDYASSVFPESSFTYLGGGQYGVVLGDETGKAFKVYRSALNYSRYEKEAGALKLLSDAGLAPKLHLFVDAGEEYRLDHNAYEYDTFGFEDVKIPRQNSGKELPVMIMDRVDTEPLENAEPTKLIDGFCRVAGVFIKENIHSWDTEIMVDKKNGEVIILDVGELSQKPFDATTAAPQAKLNHDLEILRGLTLDFGLNKSNYQIQDAYQRGGLEEVRGFLAQLLLKHKPDEA